MNDDFESWMARVDRISENELFLPTSCFPDYCWWDLWDSGLTPREAWEDYMDSDYGPGRF